MPGWTASTRICGWKRSAALRVAACGGAKVGGGEAVACCHSSTASPVAAEAINGRTCVAQVDTACSGRAERWLCVTRQWQSAGKEAARGADACVD